MAPERIFQGRQRGILELAEGKSHLYPQSRQSSHGDPVIQQDMPTAAFHLPRTRDAHSQTLILSVLPPATVGRRIVSSPPQKREQPRLDRHPGLILERVQSPLPAPGEARPPQLRSPEWVGPIAVPGFRWKASPPVSRTARSAGHFAYRCGPRLPAHADPVRLRYGRQRRCALVGSAADLLARAPVRSL